MFSSAQWRRYSIFLVALAGVFLGAGLILVRSARLVGTDFPFLSPEFSILLVLGAALTAAAFWLVWKGRPLSALGRMKPQQRWALILIWIIVSFTVLVLLVNLVSVLQPYIGPFVLWLVVIDLGLLLLAVGGIAEEGRAASKHPRWLQVVLGIVLGVLLPLLVVEFGLRIWFTYFGTEEDRIKYLYSSEEIEARSRFTGFPYINFGPSPTYREHNSLGYRGPEIAVPKPAGVFRIAALGGSTTYGTSLSNRETYPAQLQQILRDEYGYTNVEVVNAGVVQYASWDSLVNFEFRVLDLDPDMIIVYHAINDVVARLVDPAAYDGLNRVRGIWQSGTLSLSPSALYRFVAINTRQMVNPTLLDTFLRAQSEVQRCPERDYCASLGMTPAEVLAANPPTYFERNIRNLILIAQGNGVQVMISSWAYYPQPMLVGIDPVMTYPHIQAAVAEHNAITRRLAQEFELPYYDLMANLPEDVAYWLDGLHQSPTGAHEQAARYAQYLVENHLIPEPVS